MGKSILLTKEKAVTAVELVSAAFKKAVETGVSDRKTIHIVIMDPTRRPEFGDKFEDSVLYEVSIGDALEKYKKIARAKAKFTWYYKTPSQIGQQLYPHLFIEGMVKYGGSAYLHHIVVGASGVAYQFDQWVSEMVASTCRALCVGPMIDMYNSDTVFF